MNRPILLATLCLPLLTGCAAGLDALPFVYRQPVQQGNIITAEQVEQLKAGMSRRQVQFVLGSPVLMDPFHADRWDYLTADRVKGEQTDPKRLTVYFEGDRLIRADGDFALADPQLQR